MARIRTGRQKNPHKHPLGEKDGARNQQQPPLQMPTLRMHLSNPSRPAKTHDASSATKKEQHDYATKKPMAEWNTDTAKNRLSILF